MAWETATTSDISFLSSKSSVTTAERFEYRLLTSFVGLGHCPPPFSTQPTTPSSSRDTGRIGVSCGRPSDYNSNLSSGDLKKHLRVDCIA